MKHQLPTTNHQLFIQYFQAPQNPLDPIPDLSTLAREALVLLFEGREPFAGVVLVAQLRFRRLGARLQSVALAAEVVDHGDGALHPFAEAHQDLSLFGSCERELFFLRFLHSTFTGSSSATRAATLW